MAVETNPRADVGPGVQAGGGEASVEPEMKDLSIVDEAFMSYFKTIASGPRALSAAQFAELGPAHGASTVDESSSTYSRPDLKSLLDYFASPAASALAPMVDNDLTYPLSDYFISSSHNTYLTGNQLYGDASTEAYRSVLSRGCRCIEIDVWDGEDRSDDESTTSSSGSNQALGTKKKGGLKARVRNAIRNRRGGSISKHGENKTVHEKPASTLPVAWSPSGTSVVEPRVLHGHTLTKEVSFRDVCVAIRESAFEKSDLPVIVSLEIHACAAQQELMVQIMRQTWTDMLLVASEQEPQNLPSPSELKRKILIKVKAAPKQSPAAKIENKINSPAAAEAAAASDSEASADGLDNAVKKSKPAKKSKIVDALSSMGIYTRSYHFSKLDSPEASIPTHVFSLSEKKLLSVHESHGSSLFSHNRKYLMRAYPSGTRVSSSNLDPSIFWRRFGVQMVALNWQRIDAGVMLNEGEFAGSGGWVLKPPAYRSTHSNTLTGVSGQEPKPSVNEEYNLQIEILAAQDLPCSTESKGERLHPYVKCQLHTDSVQIRSGATSDDSDSSEEENVKRRTKAGRGTCPDYRGELLQFKNVSTVESLSFIRFKVKNDGRGRDSLIAWACIRMDRLRLGYRLIHLLDSKGHESKGVLLVNLVKSRI